jgi:hypothetical protein
MRVVIAAVGRLKAGPERELAERWVFAASKSSRSRRAAPARRSAASSRNRLLSQPLCRMAPSRSCLTAAAKISAAMAWRRGCAAGATAHAGRFVLRSAALTASARPCGAAPTLWPHLAPRLGRTSLCESCLWSRFTGLRPSCRGIRIIANDVVPPYRFGVPDALVQGFPPPGPNLTTMLARPA